jgi:hypothetical protein
MPLGKGVRYRVRQTSKGPVRLAFKGNKVVEAKNLKSGKTHIPSEFAKERKKRAKRKEKKRGYRERKISDMS